MNNSVIFPRKGRDARSIPRRSYNGIGTVELAQNVVNMQVELHADGLMVDGGGVGGGVIDFIRHSHVFCFEVQFGGKDIVYNTIWGNTGEKCANNRAAIYSSLRSWLRTGAIPNDPELKRQLLSIRYTHNNKDEILLESKEDLVDEDGNGISVDDVDALAITFAYPLVAHANAGGEGPHKPPEAEHEYNPYDEKRMVA